MPDDLRTGYGSLGTSITITLTSIVEGGARESTAIDNSSNLFDEADVYVAVKLPSGTPASDKTIYVYLYMSHDGSNYTDNATGSDAAVTMRSPTNFRLLGTIATPDSGALTYKAVFSTADVVRRLTSKWGIVVVNKTNLTFDSSGHSASYTGKFARKVSS